MSRNLNISFSINLKNKHLNTDEGVAYHSTCTIAKSFMMGWGGGWTKGEGVGGGEEVMKRVQLYRRCIDPVFCILFKHSGGCTCYQCEWRVKARFLESPLRITNLIIESRV
ncbi:uncharacterized protein LOC135160801 [Diachasmimorpha longicaudata]|uniref:uncharacterized protein LOC135160801 n=1 Tax=Diachasmimorpha longicaudata TaxID=58733 RepID=UPI0030B8D1EA